MRRSNPGQKFQQELAAFATGAGEKCVVTFGRNPGGSYYLDLRTYWKPPGKDYGPTKKGVRLDGSHISDLIGALTTAKNIYCDRNTQ